MVSVQAAPFIQCLNQAFKVKSPVLDWAFKGSTPATIKIDKAGVPLIAPLGILNRIWHRRDSNYHAANISAIAALTAPILANYPRLTLSQAADDLTVKTCRNVVKFAQGAKIKTPEIEALNKQVTAAKIGIRHSAFDHNPGFQQFVEKTYLERYLLEYDHMVSVDAKTQKVSLLKDGKLQPWTEIQREMKTWKESTATPHWTWIYGPEGIQNKDFHDWSELKPHTKDNPAKWHHQYVFEFCVCYNPESLLNGNHSWLRLKTPTGDIYSVGLYRPGKPNGVIGNVKTPMRIKPGYLMHPDVSEFWPFKIYSIDVAITEKDFLKMKQTIEEDNRNQDSVFQLFNNNCMLYCKKIAAIANIDIPTAESVLELTTPQKLQNRVKQFFSILPSFVKKICNVVVSFFINILLVCLGGCFIDGKLNENRKKRAVAHFTSATQLFDPEKTVLHHPLTMAFKTYPKVMEWRKQELENLKKTETNRDVIAEKTRQILLGLPPLLATI